MLCKKKCLSTLVTILSVLTIASILRDHHHYLYKACHMKALHAYKLDQQSILFANISKICKPNVPCVFPEDVNFRVIVLTYNRPRSLQKLLASLDTLELDGDSAAMEIFIDRDPKRLVDKDTMEVVLGHKWALGQKRVHVWSKHVGVYGQWIDTWRPREGSQEISLILEDDLTVSKYCYRWLKAAHLAYGHRTDVSGYTLQADMTSAKGNKPLAAPKKHTVFLYRVLGSWGFSPHPRAWRAFQDWYYVAKEVNGFHPYVNGLVMTDWYKEFEWKGKADSMWTMWHIWFTHKYNLFCLLSNLGAYLHSDRTYLAVNRQAGGLHYTGSEVHLTDKVLTSWNTVYVKFPKRTLKLDYDGYPVTDY